STPLRPDRCRQDVRPPAGQGGRVRAGLRRRRRPPRGMISATTPRRTSAMTSRRHYEVVQWATGSVGASALRAIIEHPDLELVGVVVSDPAKEGRDAGELCGVEATGVLATRDGDALLGLAPDCVCHCPRNTRDTT